MPNDKTAEHPSGNYTFTFDEGPHTYTDQRGVSYTSSTTLIKRFKERFDSDAKAARVAAREGCGPEEIKSRWEAKRDAAAAMGTRVHDNCERFLLGRDDYHAPQSERELIAMKAAVNACESIRGGLSYCEPEKLIASPQWLIAGTVDILGQKHNGAWAICDWKTNEKLETKGYNGQTMYWPLSHLQDCNVNHYALQLSIYELILRHEGYIPKDAFVERWLIHLPPSEQSAQWIPVPYLHLEVLGMLFEHRDDAMDAMPF